MGNLRPKVQFFLQSGNFLRHYFFSRGIPPDFYVCGIRPFPSPEENEFRGRSGKSTMEPLAEGPTLCQIVRTARPLSARAGTLPVRLRSC